MYNLKTASISVRKAAYAAGIRSGKWCPEDYFNADGERILARVVGNNGKAINVSDRDMTCFDSLTWQEIKRWNT